LLADWVIIRNDDQNDMRYRPDVDGLRAIAVLSVVMFHFAREWLAGGYLGVDIFFVLSGYLITRIIHKEIVDGHFTMSGFYERRIRRIAPALLFMLAVASAIALFVLLPADLEGYGKGLLATLAFVANIYSWRDTDYFARAAEDKPLLHMWSLGVEEQFYIAFPLILAFVVRRWPRLALPLVAAMTAASFLLNIVALKVGAANPAFYLFPTRAWELGCGAVVALALPVDPQLPRSSRTQSIASGVALLAIAFALVHPAPVWAFLPDSVLAVVGTAILLQTGNSMSTPVTRLLSLKPLVWVGLISYSLYLWHWPVIVFARYFLVRDLTYSEVLAAFAMMVGIGWVSYRFVEKPFRARGFPVGRLYLLSGGGALVLATVGVILIRLDGLPQRLSSEAATINAAVGTNFRCPVSELVPFGASRACLLNLESRQLRDAELVLLGNSHAQMYAPVVQDILSERGIAGLLVPLNGCLPTVVANVNGDCLSMAEKNFEALGALKKLRTVIVASNWWLDVPALVGNPGERFDNGENRAIIFAYDDLIDKLRAHGLRVVLVGPIAEPGWDVASELSRKRAFGWPELRPLGLPTKQFQERFGGVHEHFVARHDMKFLRPDLVQCDLESCRFIIDGRSLFADSNHLAAAELWRFKDMFAVAIE
jgi:peptidoglycan/LPS O-acetylase OafA/YrhL